jgi:hypothetical protein
MTRDTARDSSIESAQDFKSQLKELVETAVKADVDVRGAWEFQTKGSTHDWEVEIYELAVSDDDPDGN